MTIVIQRDRSAPMRHTVQIGQHQRAVPHLPAGRLGIVILALGPGRRGAEQLLHGVAK